MRAAAETTVEIVGLASIVFGVFWIWGVGVAAIVGGAFIVGVSIYHQWFGAKR